jgi:hypothetical protein
MVNIKRTPGTAAASVQAPDQGLNQLIQRGSLLPIISGEALEELVLGGHDPIAASYASRVGYPLPDRHELHKVAKYQSLISGWKDHQLKQDYLDLMAEHVYGLAKQDSQRAGLLEDVMVEAGSLTVSEFAERLRYPVLDQGRKDPLLILADLPLPIYVTTSPFTFIEQALARADKAPRSELCRWHSGLGNIPSVFAGAALAETEAECEHNRKGGVYRPCKHKPLVYHLYGLDAHPDSLLLTEDDYLTFLMAASQGRGKDRGVDPIHDVVKGALQSSALLLMGFGLSTWSFRALYWGLIRPSPDAKLYERYCCIQLIPSEQEKRYLESYLRQDAHFDKVYWEPIASFCRRELEVGR